MNAFLVNTFMMKNARGVAARIGQRIRAVQIRPCTDLKKGAQPKLGPSLF
jgi:hypothetical protein